MAYEALVDHCLELMSSAGAVRSRRMFGGQGIYLEGLFVALIAYNRLYLKTSDQTRQRFIDAGGEPFVYDGHDRPVTVTAYWTPPPEAMESPALMAPWARLALQAALSAKAAVKPRATPAARRASGRRR